MSATDAQIIEALGRYGHLNMPFGKPAGHVPQLDVLKLSDPIVTTAVQSYQEFHSQTAEPLIAKHHPQRLSAAIVPDGDVGPATRDLFALPRCGHPDYDGTQPMVAEAGQGNWRGCWGVGDFHSAIVRFTNEPPGFLQPHIDEVWSRVVDAYADMGCLFIREDNGRRPNITVEFTVGQGWIGLAIVGQGETCGTTIWAKFDRNYQPRNIVNEWTSLLMHELGHNSGLGHSRGGIMNPSIINGLPPTWRGDASEQLLIARFGGVPVPRDDAPGERELVQAWRYPDGRLEFLQTIPGGNGGFPQ